MVESGVPDIEYWSRSSIPAPKGKVVISYVKPPYKSECKLCSIEAKAILPMDKASFIEIATRSKSLRAAAKKLTLYYGTEINHSNVRSHLKHIHRIE
jgi:hypothetical protein